MNNTQSKMYFVIGRMLLSQLDRVHTCSRTSNQEISIPLMADTRHKVRKEQREWMKLFGGVNNSLYDLILSSHNTIGEMYNVFAEGKEKEFNNLSVDYASRIMRTLRYYCSDKLVRKTMKESGISRRFGRHLWNIERSTENYFLKEKLLIQ